VLDEGVRALLVDVVQLPASAGSPPLARINLLREAPDGSGRLFVNDLRGPLHVIDGGSVSTYFDLSSVFSGSFKDSPGLATGFVSFAFHPEFAQNGLLYTVHTEFLGATPANLEPAVPSAYVHHAVLTEFTAADPSASVFSGTRRELMRVAAVHHFHNLGEIAFHPNAQPGDTDYGLLYIGSGDFGSVATGQPEQLQRLDTPYGAVLRIDPLGGPFLRGGIPYDYGIPASNPFVDNDSSTLDEILLYGVRNAHRLIWGPDPFRRLYLADVGQGNVEELNRAAPGANYGWPLREGTFALDVASDPETVLPLPANDSGFTYPLAQYDHEEGLAIAGGVVPQSAVPTPLSGTLVFGDIASGRLFYAALADLLAVGPPPAERAPVYELGLIHEGQGTTLLQVVRDALGQPGLGRTDLRLGQDLSGRVYVTTKQDGWVRQLVPLPDPVPAAPRWGLGLAAVALVLAAGATLRLRSARR
jgi:glucose/arabinose dehydrogenase